MKKFIITAAIILLTINNAYCANYMTCEQAMNTGKPFVLYLHSNTCYACKQFTPIFTKIMDTMQSQNVVDINYSYPQAKNVCSSAETRTIPAVYVVNPQKRTRSKINFETYYDEITFKNSLTNLLNQ